MIRSSIINSLTAKELSATDLPNWLNTLHENLKHGNHGILDYCQKINSGESNYLQFESDLDETPVLKSYLRSTNAVIETISVTKVSEIIGDDNRYYYNAVLVGSASYLEKEFYMILTQGSSILTFEPIYCYDMTTDIANGIIKKIRCTNFQSSTQVSSDLNGYFIDWTVGGDATDHCMAFWVEGQLREMGGKDESELLEGSQSVDLISSSHYSGRVFKTDPLPDYMIEKLKAATLLVFWTINDLQYIREGALSVEPFGGSTSFQATIKANQKNALGINVDNLGITSSTEDTMITNDNQLNQTADFDREIPDMYVVHDIIVAHSASSSGNNAAITIGYSLGGTEIVDAVNGEIVQADDPHSFPVHNSNSLTAASRIYIGISGSGVVLDFYIQFIKRRSS